MLLTYSQMLLSSSMILIIMSMLPDADKDYSDFLSFMADACKKESKILQKDGTILTEFKVDWKKPYYKLQLINSPNYSRFVYEVERLEGMAIDAFNRMPIERAKIIYEQIMNLVDSYRYSMDAKSSEILRNKDNTQSSLTHLLTRIRIERNYNSMEEQKKGILAGVFGDKEKDNRQA